MPQILLFMNQKRASYRNFYYQLMKTEVFRLNITKNFLARGLVQLRDRPPRGTVKSLSESFLGSGRQISLHIHILIPTLRMEVWTGYSNGSVDGSFK